MVGDFDETFDYIVVGAGSAGCVVAARLSETPGTRVLLLEAGGEPRSFWLKIPIGIGRIINNMNYMWPYRTEPIFNDRSLAWFHGKVLGGSSGVNAMLYVHGAPELYDKWASTGCAGWDFESCLRYFQKLESIRFDGNETRGRHGPVPVTRLEVEDPISKAFVEACKAVGICYTKDYNGRDISGVGSLQLNALNGVRYSMYKAYLSGHGANKNICITANATVARIVFEGSRAVGVEYMIDGRRHRAGAVREVIVSAGALHTPKILELSGIGNAEILKTHGVEVVHNLPGVGENLCDHFHSRVSYRTNQPVTANDLFINKRFAVTEALKYAFFRKGLLATPSFRVHAFERSPVSPYPDMRIQCGLSSSASRYVANGIDAFSGFHIGSYFLYPKSHGSVHIKSASWQDLPRITARYLAHEDDVQAAIWGIRRSRQISAAVPLASYVIEETRPGRAVQSDDELLSFIKETGETSWHPVGSCKMSEDRTGVVDSQLRVRGVQGLRVADASVMPFHTSSNTNIPTAMIGERAADFLKASARGERN